MDDPPAIKKGVPLKAALKVLAPWRNDQERAGVKVEMPGLKVLPQVLALPGNVEIVAPAEAEPGYYYVLATGDCLPLKRWIPMR